MAEQRGLSCSVCYNNFKSDEDQYVPRNLSCGHTYCTGCLTKLAFQTRSPGHISCPTCKMETALCPRYDGVRGLSKNFGVLEILEGKEEVEVDGIQSEKEKNKYLCPEHDEALKVYCHTDNCLICIYCQVYGKHAGHNCELATNIATSTREELRSLSKRLGDYHDIVKKARKKVVDSKDAILNTQQYLRKRIMKHMAMLRACMARREAMLKCEVDSKTTEKLKSMDAQESDMTEIIKKCDLAYSLIQKCQSNDSALVEEKNNVYALIDKVASSMEKCELEPKACDNLTYYFEYDIACTLETKIGEIRMLKPGQKEEPLAGLYAHELSGKKQTKEAGSQTENWDNDHPLFESLIHGLEEIVHTGLTAQSWQDESPSLLAEEESSDDSPSEPASDETDNNSDDVADDDDDDDDDDDGDDDDDQLEGAVGGLLLPAAPRQGTEHRSSDEEASHLSPDEPGLLNELQKEIERLRLLGPRGNVVRLTDELSGSVSDPDGERGPGSEDTRESRVLLSSPNQQVTGGEKFSLDSKLHSLEQRITIREGLSLASNPSSEQQTAHCSAVNCQCPDAHASLKCRHCKRVYCTQCAPLSFSCSKKPGGHRFVSTLLNSQPTAAARSRRGGSSGHKKAKVHSKALHPQPKEEGLSCWECNHCTMLNGAQVLVCLGCDTLRDSDARDGRNVCPMCTLVNEPGNIKCELCDTDLVSQEQAGISDPEE